MNQDWKKDRGLIKFIIIIVIALVILGYYGFSVRQAIEAPASQDNLNFFKDICIKIWLYILRAPALFIWENVILPLIHRFVHV